MGICSQRGFTYLAMLFAVAISAIALNGALALWSLEERRDQERELLFIGGQFRQAIASYYEHSPGPDKQYPASLEALLADTRFTPAQRHLRHPYADPLARPHARKWALVRTAGGQVMGVYSDSAQTPLKRANFSKDNEQFTGKTRYADWKFVYDKGHDKNVPAVFLPQP